MIRNTVRCEAFISHTLSSVEILKCEEFSSDGNELITNLLRHTMLDI